MIDPNGETVEPTNVKVLHVPGTNRYKVVADLDIKIQVLNISSTATQNLFLRDYANKVKEKLSEALNKTGTMNLSTDLAQQKSKSNPIVQTGKLESQVWEYEVNVNVRIEIIDSKEQIEKGSHLLTVVDGFSPRKSSDLPGNPIITPVGFGKNNTAFVSAEEVKKFGGELTAGHEILHLFGLGHFWNIKPGDKNQKNFMEYYEFADFSLTDEQRGSVFSTLGLSPYNMLKYFSPKNISIPLKEHVKSLNQYDTKAKLDENKTAAGTL